MSADQTTVHTPRPRTRERERARARARPLSRKSLAVILISVLTGCATDNPEPEPDYSGLGDFDTSQVVIIRAGDTVRIVTEVARTEDQHQLGLMERKSLPEQQGMLFVYSEVQDSTASFWMFRTRIPLDIAFADSVGVIRSILQMQPCDSPNPQLCRAYPANARFMYALEMNLGFFARHGINIGDTLRIAESR